MPTLPYFPASLLREGAVEWTLMGAAVGGGQTLSGVAPASELSGGGYWTAQLTDISLTTADQVRAWRALESICDNGVQPIVVPMCDKRTMPAPLVSGARLYSYDDVLHAGDVPFSTGVGYHHDVVAARLWSSAALRATALTIVISYGSALRGGERFAIDDAALRWRLYTIATAAPLGNSVYAVTVRPPLRAAAAADTRIVFDQPKCVMRIATPGAMRLALTLRREGKPSVSFIEAFPPF